MTFTIPGRLAASCRDVPERAAWLAQLPDMLRDLEQRWSLTLGAPFDGDGVSCAWVAPVALATGRSAVLKLGMPHMEPEAVRRRPRIRRDPAPSQLRLEASFGP